MALIERPVQGHSNEEGTGAPQQGSTAVRTVCFCFHYDGSRKNVNKIFKNSSAERVEKIRQKTRRQLHWTKQIAGILRHIPYRNEMCWRE
jgi:RNA:NAD 2'-phosphotransferase (TPT1/KptA family)